MSETGTIIEILESRGFGWIRLRGRRERVFFSASDLTDGLVFGEQLLQLDVRFEPDLSDSRGTRARNIRPEFV